MCNKLDFITEKSNFIGRNEEILLQILFFLEKYLDNILKGCTFAAQKRKQSVGQADLLEKKHPNVKHSNVSVMKRFLNFTVCMVTVMGALVACNEDDFLYENNREERTFEVVVVAETCLTDADAAIVATVLTDNNVDTSSMLVTTGNVVELASTIELQLEPVESAMMIGFKLEGRDASDERYAARVVLGGYVIE